MCGIERLGARQIWLQVPVLLLTNLLVLGKVTYSKRVIRVLSSFVRGVN